MRSAILMSSVAIAAMAAPAFALPDRYEPDYRCVGTGPLCVQESLRTEDGNRGDEKSSNVASDEGLGAATAARSGDDDDIGDEIGATADEAGDEISEAADEAGDEISAAADEAGDEISEAADEAGDEIGDAFD